MKLSRFVLFLMLLGGMTACQSHRNDCCDEVVCETVHRYGVSLAPEDWSARGQHGQVTSMRKDGVCVTRNYDAGVLHGECSYTFPYRSIIQTKEIYNQGQLSQEEVHYPCGLPLRQTIFTTPNHCSVTTWYESGAPHARETFAAEHLIDGEYYSTEQQIESRVENGSGLRTCRDGQGQLQCVDSIENGQMVLKTSYHPNGIPATVTPYVNGVIEGECRTYLSDGEPATIESWRGDAQHGITHVFEQGEKRAEISYVNGCKHGLERRYRDDGKTVAQDIVWVREQKHGPAYSYIGDRTITDWYFRDKPVANKATFDMLTNQ
jgi:antitoxin component YwqK of YwqJK toxin-antitoxin module